MHQVTKIIYEEHTFDSPQELFEAVMNKDIYMDYLSIGAPMNSDFVGLRNLAPEYFKDRARLDALKFSPLAEIETAFTGQGTYKNISANIGLPAHGNVPAGPNDSLSRTAYSYLTPSIVEFSDPSKSDKTFGIHYTAFNLFARSKLIAGASTVHSFMFADLEEYDRLSVALLDYNKNKQNYIDADVTDPFGTVDQFGDEGAPSGWTIEQIETRETYKNLMEDAGLTLHDASVYNNFFNKRRAGALSPEKTKQDVGERYPTKVQDSSDAFLFSHNYFKLYVKSTNQNLIPQPPIVMKRPYSYAIDLPNSFKFDYIQTKRLINGETGIFNETFNNVWAAADVSKIAGEGLDTKEKYDSFLTFQTNLTAKIEVFTPGTFPKNDEFTTISSASPSCWSPLTINHINSLFQPDESLFCRIVLYNERLAHNISAPILDRYFLINELGVNTIPEYPQPIHHHVVHHDDGGEEFWEQKK